MEVQPTPHVDSHAMAQGIIPLKYPGLPGVVKLPKRYEKAALGDPKTAKYRRVSISSGSNHLKETISARLDDLVSATMWVKQELILLRQHDIILKRQFFNIHDSIQSLQPKKTLSSSTTSLSLPCYPTVTPTLNPRPSLTTANLKPNKEHLDIVHGKSLSPLLPSYPTQVLAYSSSSSSTRRSKAIGLPASSPSASSIRLKSSTSVSSLNSPPSSSPSSPQLYHSSPSSRLPLSLADFQLDTYCVRPSVSVSALNRREETDDTDGEDTFDEDFFRPRTSSMRTSRDLAALARRRGSKELIGIFTS